MKLKIVFSCVLLLMLSNCGSSKKTVKSKTNKTYKEKQIKSLPKVNEDKHIEKLEKALKD